ncbi:MAG: Uncharacterized protein G01um101425_660 [Candidatus Peregrinibacteria bacterium Gr01-1014_25]|nr:MAG: Uncharacterized protein G01um101425_660 [Candidatus Peregrinibacteria bacterium Gr01-1014_25]
MMNAKTFKDVALLALRLIIAAVFINAGYAKLMFWGPLPEGMTMSANMVYLTQFLSIVEPLGGIALAVGFLTFWAAAGLAVIMVGASYFVYFVMQSAFFTGATGTGLDYVLLLLAGCLVLMACGSGNWSVDAKWKR